jgi:hypothetical protein
MNVTAAKAAINTHMTCRPATSSPLAELLGLMGVAGTIVRVAPETKLLVEVLALPAFPFPAPVAVGALVAVLFIVVEVVDDVEAVPAGRTNPHAGAATAVEFFHGSITHSVVICMSVHTLPFNVGAKSRI